MRPVLAHIALFVAACGEEGADTGGAADTGQDLFCAQPSEADRFEIVEGGASGANGSLLARLITDAAEDPHNPNYVAKVTYILENLDVGGSPRYGESDNSGEILATLGAGRWRVQVSNNRVAGVDCYNTMDFDIEAGHTTQLCLDVRCE